MVYMNCDALYVWIAQYFWSSHFAENTYTFTCDVFKLLHYNTAQMYSTLAPFPFRLKEYLGKSYDNELEWCQLEPAAYT